MLFVILITQETECYDFKDKYESKNLHSISVGDGHAVKQAPV